jgi:hypothetical protein
MNYYHLGGAILWLWLSLVGCRLIEPQTRQPNTPATDATETSSASSTITETTDRLSSEATVSTMVAQFHRDPNNPNLLRDYDPTAPIPATGQTTIRGSIRNLNTNRMIAECPADSAPYAYAESTNHRVQICSAEFDPWLPKYFMGQSKDGSSDIRITNEELESAQQLVFNNGDRTYALSGSRDRAGDTNVYLEIRNPDGTTYAEALLYFYEQTDRPVPET